MAQKEEKEKPQQKGRELTEREQILWKLARARKFHKESVRWLFDTNRLRSMYEKNVDSWRGSRTPNEKMLETSEASHADAEQEVINTRLLVDRVVKELEEYDERHI